MVFMGADTVAQALPQGAAAADSVDWVDSLTARPLEELLQPTSAAANTSKTASSLTSGGQFFTRLVLRGSVLSMQWIGTALLGADATGRTTNALRSDPK